MYKVIVNNVVLKIFVEFDEALNYAILLNSNFEIIKENVKPD